MVVEMRDAPLPQLTRQKHALREMRDAEKQAARARSAMVERHSEGSQVGERLCEQRREMSGGECQRVAIARAMVVRPAILLADKPTGNLDNATGAYVSDMIFDLVKEHKMTLLFVTHNEQLAKRCSREQRLQNGRFI